MAKSWKSKMFLSHTHDPDRVGEGEDMPASPSHSFPAVPLLHVPPESPRHSMYQKQENHAR